MDIFGNALLLPQDVIYKPTRRPPPLLTHKSSSALYPQGSDPSLPNAGATVTSPNSAATNRRYKRHTSHADDALHKLQTCSLQATKHGRIFRFMKLGVLRVSQREFRHILQEMNIGLTSREEFLLMKRYIDGNSSSVNLPMFIEEFKRLGSWGKVRDATGVDDAQPEQVTPQKPRGGRLPEIRRLSKGTAKKSPVFRKQESRISPAGSKHGRRASPTDRKKSKRIADKSAKPPAKKSVSQTITAPSARVPSPVSWNNVNDPLETVVESEASARGFARKESGPLVRPRPPRDDIFADIVNAYPDPLQEIRSLIDVNRADKAKEVAQPKTKVKDDIFSRIVQSYPDSGDSKLFSFPKPSEESLPVESHSPFEPSSLPPVSHTPSKPRNTTELMAKLLQSPSPKLSPLLSTENAIPPKPSASVPQEKPRRPMRDELFSEMVNSYPKLEPVIKVRPNETNVELNAESKEQVPRKPKDDIFANMVSSYPTLDPVIVVKAKSCEDTKTADAASHRPLRDDLFAKMVQSYPTLDPVIEIRKPAETSPKRPPRDDLFSLVVDSYPTLEPVIQITPQKKEVSDAASIDIAQVQAPFAQISDAVVEDDYADEAFEASGSIDVEQRRSFNQDDGGEVVMHRQNSRDHSDGEPEDFDL